MPIYSDTTAIDKKTLLASEAKKDLAYGWLALDLVHTVKRTIGDWGSNRICNILHNDKIPGSSNITSFVFGGEFGVSSPCNYLFQPSDPQRGWTGARNLLWAAHLAVPHGVAGNKKNLSPLGFLVLS